AAPPVAAATAQEPPPKWRFWEKQEAEAQATPLLLPAPNDAVTDEQVAQAAAEMAAAEAVTPPPAMTLLAGSFGLSRFEREILLLCAAMELDPRTATHCARAQDNPQRPHPTFALAMVLFDEPEWNALSPEGP